MASSRKSVRKKENVEYTSEQVEAIALKLRELPPIEKQIKHSKQETVKLLAKEIVALQKRGYTLDQIAAALRGEGLDIATPTLKSYLQRAKPSKSHKKSVSTSGIKPSGKGSEEDTPPPAPPAVFGTTTDSSVVTSKNTEKLKPRSTFTPKPDTRDI